ncbi:MAG TPA: sigma 54-interacting transcriptional regulator [Solirubrobacterales bacterium]|nr:sigma 54-interacting transcriptional regulator [Solirubrobacterales bacterium]
MDALADLIGDSPPMLSLRRTARTLLQRLPAMRRLPPILIQGETGTGKGLLARLIHRGGPRAGRPFVDVNCAAIPDTLLEAELFGYERGAFTDARQAKPGLFQTAGDGMLFLDEIALLPLALQAKLLTVLEQGIVRRLGATRTESVNAWIVTATNEDLAAATQSGRFREDLYHRLAVLTLEMPPLRARAGDIERLAERFLARACTDYGLPPKSLSEDARAALRTYSWPGNVRELSNVLEQAALLSESTLVTGRMLALPTEPAGAVGETAAPGGTSRERMSRELETTLLRTGWNVSRTASALGITRNTVRARIERYGLRPPGSAGQAVRPQSSASSPGPPVAAVPADIESRAPASPAAGVRWERRRITLLRASIVAVGDDPHPAMSRVLDDVVVKVQTFGGRVQDVSQRGLVGVFGLQPIEDGPRRAANAAIAVLKTLERDWETGRLREAVDVAFGIHAIRGLVACIGSARELDQESKAEAWATVARLASLAPHDIALSEAAASLLARHFEVRRLETSGDPVYRLAGREAVTSYRAPTSFVGRSREVAQLGDLLESVRDGRGQVVSIVGEPGIGKSRLLDELRQRVADDFLVLEGRCVSYGTQVPYLPIIDLLHAVCGVQEVDSPEKIQEKVRAALARVGPVGLASAPYVEHLLSARGNAGVAGEAPATVRARTFDALQHLILAQQAHRPLVLVIEDLHWIDKTSEDLLGAVADIAVGARLLLVGTYRPGYQPPWGARSHVSQIALGPLSPAESRRLATSLLPSGAGEPVVSAILVRADGNPFFLEELARAVREHAGARLDVPETVHDVLAARIDALPESDQRTLRTAAVIGRDVPLALLSEVSGLAPDALRPVLAGLQASEFLYATRLGAEPEYTFKHALTYDVAYDGLVEAERPALHARVAAAIEKLAPEVAQRRPEMLARHYTEAGRPATAVGYWLRAGQLAAQRSAHRDAIALLTTGLALLETLPGTPDRDHQEIPFQLGLASSLAAIQGYGAPDVERPLLRARALTQRLGEAPSLFAVRWALWRFHLSRADFHDADELANQLLATARRMQEALPLVGAHVAAGVIKFYRGELARARSHLEEVIHAIESSDTATQVATYGQDLGVAALGFLGWTLAVTGDMEAAAALADRTVTRGRDVEHPFSLALALMLAAEVRQLRREPASVRSLGEELLALSRDRSFTFFSAFGLMLTGWARLAAGEDEGLATMREGADLFRSVGQRVGLAHRAHLAEALFTAGGPADALGVVEDALRQSSESGEHAFDAELLRVKGEALARLGRLEEAERSLREAVDLGSGQDAWLFALRAATSLVGLAETPASAPDGSAAMLAAIVDRFSPSLALKDLDVARARVVSGAS